MAKSLRSKSKLKAKSVKRGKEFQKAVDERQARIFNKAKENLIKQKAQEAKDKSNETITNDDEDDKMIVDAEEKKVSTSGYRTARHHLYKKNQKKKNSYTSYSKNKK